MYVPLVVALTLYDSKEPVNNTLNNEHYYLLHIWVQYLNWERLSLQSVKQNKQSTTVSLNEWKIFYYWCMVVYYCWMDIVHWQQCIQWWSIIARTIPWFRSKTIFFDHMTRSLLSENVASIFYEKIGPHYLKKRSHMIKENHVTTEVWQNMAVEHNSTKAVPYCALYYTGWKQSAVISQTVLSMIIWIQIFCKNLEAPFKENEAMWSPKN